MAAAVDPSSQADLTAPATTSAYGKGYVRYALSLLMIVYIVNFVDRTIINILIEPIKLELKLLDWQLGLLSGLAFGLIYTTLTFPLAIVADRRNRSKMIAISLTIWSGFTVLSGFAQNFVHLLIARAGVGIGEAGCVPAAHALIADYTDRERRASALAFFAIGGPIGGLLGLAVGGLIADYYGWRLAFFVAGAPGLLIAALVFLTLREPRLSRYLLDTKAPSQATFAESLRYLRHKRAFWCLGIAGGVRSFTAYGQGPFLASFYYRAHGPELGTLAASWGMRPQTFMGLSLAIVTGVVAVAATWLGGYVCDRYSTSSFRIYGRFTGWSAILLVPFGVLSFMVSDLQLSLILLAVAMFLSTVWGGPVYAAAQGMVPVHMRAKSSAIMIFMLNFFGLVFGAVIVGTISDVANKDIGLGEVEGIRWALILTMLFSAIAAPAFWQSMRTIDQDIES